MDLKYPSNLHKKHNDFPLAPEKMSVPTTALSPYQQRLREELKSTGLAAPKLVPNLMDKRNYILDYRVLQLYLQLGLEVTAFHKALKFDQSAWMAL